MGRIQWVAALTCPPRERGKGRMTDTYVMTPYPPWPGRSHGYGGRAHNHSGHVGDDIADHLPIRLDTYEIQAAIVSAPMLSGDTFLLPAVAQYTLLGVGFDHHCNEYIIFITVMVFSVLCHDESP